MAWTRGVSILKGPTFRNPLGTSFRIVIRALPLGSFRVSRYDARVTMITTTPFRVTVAKKNFLLCCGYLLVSFFNPQRMKYKPNRAVNPKAASSLASGKCFKVFIMTLYDASRVLNIFWTPISAGIWVVAIVKALPVTNPATAGARKTLSARSCDWHGQT